MENVKIENFPFSHGFSGRTSFLLLLYIYISFVTSHLLLIRITAEFKKINIKILSYVFITYNRCVQSFSFNPD